MHTHILIPTDGSDLSDFIARTPALSRPCPAVSARKDVGKYARKATSRCGQ
jgi:hypothetical protein